MCAMQPVGPLVRSSNTRPARVYPVICTIVCGPYDVRSEVKKMRVEECILVFTEKLLREIRPNICSCMVAAQGDALREGGGGGGGLYS